MVHCYSIDFKQYIKSVKFAPPQQAINCCLYVHVSVIIIQ